MPSPFPGMDPYLEDSAVWEDFHITLIVAMRAEINAVLPQGYVASADRHVWIEDPESGDVGLRDPDVFISRTKAKGRIKKSRRAVAVAEPHTITLPRQAHKGKPFLKITDSRERRVVTAIELLSPANKAPGNDRDSYLEKREEYFGAGINLVEINLLRKGRCPPLGQPSSGDYYILVCKARDLPKADIWRFSVRQPFPDVFVPLRSSESIPFNLRRSVDRTYEEARYDVEIDYAKPPFPRLDEKDAAWARDLIGVNE